MPISTPCRRTHAARTAIKSSLRAVDVAVEARRQKGFNVTVTVVNLEGAIITLLR